MYRLYLHSIWKSSKNLFLKNYLMKKKFGSKSKYEVTFSDLIDRRKKEANRSVVVQVHSENSYGDLYSYCNNFGAIASAHHYKIKEDNSNYILIEYKEEASMEGVLKSAKYDSNLGGIPAHSPLLWFKAVSKDAQENNLSVTKNLKISDGLNQLNETNLLKLILSAENISDQIKMLYESTKLNDLEIRLRFLAAKQVEKSISGIFPHACALPFGSSVNGFGKMGCDLDLVLSFQNENIKENYSRLIFHTKENLTNERAQIQKQMESLSDILQIFLPGVSNVRRILQARVPIIKFHHLILNLDVDLTMSNISGVYMSELLYIFGKIDCRVQPLIFSIRKWAQIVGLTNPSPGRWITNFSLSCLVIFFLQQNKNPVLPSINYLNKAATTNDIRFTDEGIDCTFVRDCNNLNFVTSNDSNLNELLLQFFEYYSQFDFNSRAISLNKGSSIIKPDNSSLYIVNPLDQTLNVSKNISLEECERFRIEVRNAAWILENEAERPLVNEVITDHPWGIANLFRNSQKNYIKPNMFYRPRMMEIKTLFTEKIENDTDLISNGKVKNNLKVLGMNLSKRQKVNKGNDS